jgi:SAM-dependent methyltransferase
MTIYYIGNFTQKHCTEVHLALTLEQLGHTVIRAQENELGSQWAGDIVVGGGVDLVLYTRTWGDYVQPQDIAYLRENGITTASYHLDLYVGLERKYLHQGRSLAEILKTDPFWQTDYVFTPDGDPKSQAVFKANGVRHHYIRPGVYKGECELVEPEAGKMQDVLFVGGGDYPGSPLGYGHPEWPYRDRLIEWLRNTYGERFKKYGHPNETVRNAELNQLYANAKVVIGDSVCLDFKHTNYWSDRIYETIGRGGFIIHPYIKGLEREFTDGKNIIFYEYGNWAQLKQLIDHWTDPVNEDERIEIRNASFELVKANSTYTNRLQEALGIIGDPTELIVPIEAIVPTPAGLEPQRSAKKINLGCGREPDLGEDWCNVDLLDGPGVDVTTNLLHFPYPFAGRSAEYIKAIDLLEHLPNYTPDYRPTVIAFVEECHRILQPGGTLFIQVPHFASPNMWIDPTHVRGFDPKSMDYFDPTTDFGTWYGYYSDCKFKVTCEVQNLSSGTPNNLKFTMVKV